jgi:predicted kinase
VKIKLEDTMKTLYMMIGIPGSGKSYWRQNFKGILISPDDILETEFNYEWSPAHVGYAWKKAYQQLGSGLLGGQNLVFDAVFATPFDRSAILNIAKGCGWSVVAVFMNTPLSVCMERNALRPENRRVPESKMKDFARRMTHPFKGEGWDDIIDWVD